jgi:hypothetical protein
VKEVGVELVDTPENIGNDGNFVSWKTLEVGYKVIPEEIPSSAYLWEVVPGSAIKDEDGHSFLGTPAPQNRVDDITNKILSFVPGSTGSSEGSGDKSSNDPRNLRARPLAFDLKFSVNNQVVKTFTIEQSYKNAIREEYRVFANGYVGVSVDELPTIANFAPVSGQLIAQYIGPNSYDPADVPNGNNLNKLGTALENAAHGQYYISSGYRNPYRNSIWSDMNSRHVWSDAFDLLDANRQASEQLRTVWDGIKTLADFGQVIVESQDDVIFLYLYDYLMNTLHEPYEPGSVSFWMPDSKDDATYEILWTKQKQLTDPHGNGWKEIKIYWTGTDGKNWSITHQLSEDDWNNNIVTNLHAQGATNSGWGF